MGIGSFSRWYLISDTSKGLIIRRYSRVEGKIVWQTFPRQNYCKCTRQEASQLVNLLNSNASTTTKKINIPSNLKYFNKDLIKKFSLRLHRDSASKKHVQNILYYLEDYVIKYFVIDSRLIHPADWKNKEESFGEFLIKKNLSTSTLKKICQTANRYQEFLEDLYPNELRLRPLKPISKSYLKFEDFGRLQKRPQYISQENFELICTSIRTELIPIFKLSYFFGLRCSEVLGLKKEDLYQDCLVISRQLICLLPTPLYGPPKSRSEREIPFWFTHPQETLKLIKALPLIHPHTLSRLFSSEMRKLRLPYKFHDIRRTFITRALRSYPFLDVRLAVGHTNIETTRRYIQDDRRLQRIPIAINNDNEVNI